MFEDVSLVDRVVPTEFDEEALLLVVDDDQSTLVEGVANCDVGVLEIRLSDDVVDNVLGWVNVIEELSRVLHDTVKECERLNDDEEDEEAECKDVGLQVTVEDRLREYVPQKLHVGEMETDELGD